MCEVADACIEAELDAVGQGGVAGKQVETMEGGVPSAMLVWCEGLTVSALEGRPELHDPAFRIQSKGGVGNGRWLNTQ